MTQGSVRRSVTVEASPEHAFHVFTHEMDTWWPRTHHIGKSPMTRVIVEERVGGRCYSEQEDGTECDWASVLVWDPPRTFTMAWRINPQWQFEADPAKASEVEVTFTPVPDGRTRVDLEHRHFSRHGAGWETMPEQVGSSGGWGTLLELFAAKASAARALS